MNTSPTPPPSPSSPANGNPSSLDQSADSHPNTAPGFRFHPTDEELISNYLNRKVSNLQLPIDAIAEVDLYKHDPWDLPSLSRLRSRDREWFFFTLVDRKYGGSHRANRATPAGYWKSSGRDREVRCGEKVVGMKKCLIFHVGRCPTGRRTDWLMHEYRRLEEDDKKASGTFFVVCRVFNKSTFGQQKWDHHGVPFVEDQWEEEEDEENDNEEPTIVVQDLASSKETMPDELIAEDGEQDHIHSNDIEQGTTEAICNINQSIISCESSFSKLNPPSEGGLVPGFRFHPTDEELVAYYLKRKVSGLPLRGDAISEVNLYKLAPWDLPPLSRLSLQNHNTEWYFFTIVDRKQGPNRCSLHANRITPEGYWKSTGNDCSVRSPVAAKVIGMKKCLIFHKGRSPHGQRTNWVMHEYRLEDEQNPITSLPVVCRVYQKSGYGPRKKHAWYAVPFCEECEESAQDLSPIREAPVSTTEAQFPISEIFREAEVQTKEAEHLGKELNVATMEALSSPNVDVDVATEQDHVKASNDIQQGTNKKNQKIYGIGSQVEVAYIREKLPVAWYTATVMDIENEGILSVEYLSLRNDDGTLLSEIVSTQYVRPRSPSTLEIRHFELLDEVEAFYNGGWWPGVVAKVNKGLKYNVKFMHLEEEIEFSNKELRLLYDWVDGQWIMSSQDKFMETQNLGRPEPADHMQLLHASNSARKCKVPVSVTPSTYNVNETCEFPISSTNNVGENSGRPPSTSNVIDAPFVIPISSTNDVSKNSDRSPSSMVNETPCVIPISSTNDVDESSDRSPLIGNVNEAPCVIPISSLNDVNESTDRPPLTNYVSEAPCVILISSTKYMDENSDRPPSTNYVSESPRDCPISSMNNGNKNIDICPLTNYVNEACCEYPVSSINNVNEASHEFSIFSTNNVNENLERCHPTKDVSEDPREFPISSTNDVNENLERSPPINCVSEAPREFPISFTNNGSDNSNSSTFQSQLEDVQPHKKAKKGERTEDNSRLLDSRGAETSSTVKIGFDVRTPIIEEEPNFRIKTLVEKFCSVGPFKNINLVSADSIANPPSNILLGEINEEPSIPDRSTQEFIPELDRQEDKGVKQHTTVDKRRKNCRPQKLRIIEPSLEGESMGNHIENEVMQLPVERHHRTQCGTCDNVLEAQALFNANASSSDTNLVETSISSVQPSENGTEGQNEVLSTEAHVKKGRLYKSPPEQLPLPFDKCSSIWDSIESMEVFNVMPQRPHFCPLEQYCREFREGIAIGLMVTFSNLVNNINKLDVADSRHKFDGIMKTLVHLEGHGFDVQRIRAHLVEMQRAKDTQEQLVNERSTLKSKLAKRKREKDKLNVVIESIEKASQGLEHSLSRLYKGKSCILERKRENDSRLDNLEMDSRRLDDALLSAESDFEATRSAKW